MQKNLIIALSVIVVILGAVLLVSGPAVPEETTAVTQPETSQGVPPVASGEVATIPSAVREFVVEGSNFKFAPAVLTVNVGERVRIVFKNSGGFHDLKIDEFKVATKKLQGGAQETVEFIADRAGSFEYYCSVGEHRQMGMKGTLIVK